MLDIKELKVSMCALGFEPTNEDIRKMLCDNGKEGLDLIEFDHYL